MIVLQNLLALSANLPGINVDALSMIFLSVSLITLKPSWTLAPIPSAALPTAPVIPENLEVTFSTADFAVLAIAPAFSDTQLVTPLALLAAQL